MTERNQAEVEELISKTESLYHTKAIGENTLGNSPNLIFELSSGDQRLIVRGSDYSEYKMKHVQFEMNWLSYLAEEIDEVVKPVASNPGNLFETAVMISLRSFSCRLLRAIDSTAGLMSS